MLSASKKRVSQICPTTVLHRPVGSLPNELEVPAHAQLTGARAARGRENLRAGDLPGVRIVYGGLSTERRAAGGGFAEVDMVQGVGERSDDGDRAEPLHAHALLQPGIEEN